jgi:beta-N-acetylhexosaminidase
MLEPCPRVKVKPLPQLSRMTIVAQSWRLRPFRPTADRALVETLWRTAMPPAWPLLPAGVTMLNDGLIALAETQPVGFVAADLAGSIPLILVDPAHQRCGIGTALLDAALRRLSEADATEVTAGSGGSSYIWPGVPLDLPAAVSFFTAHGWEHRHDTLDLVADLHGYQSPATAYDRVTQASVTITVATMSQSPAVLAFETATFPSWARWFQPSDQTILIATDSAGAIAGTLLFQGPDADTVFSPLLGPDAGTIGCVGVAPRQQGHGIGTAMVTRASEILRDAGTRSCHIGWTDRESFYTRAGYHPWRRYRMFRRRTQP